MDALARRLTAEGVAAAAYHAKLPGATRADVLTRWNAGELQVVAASVAFGLGVDKGECVCAPCVDAAAMSASPVLATAADLNLR